ncbi:Siroheme biosynthesis protein met8 [Fusarium oxysporum f. sp. albedinis]|nr:Siroheme biosynthesis protein met8 [Fusarium oxysporum f. sp. albedinis]
MTYWCHRRVCGSLFMRRATAARCFRHKWTAVKQFVRGKLLHMSLLLTMILKRSRSANRLNNQKVRSWRLNHERQTTTPHLYRQPEDADHDVS